MTKYIQTAAVVLCLCMVLWAAGLADGAAKKEEAEQDDILQDGKIVDFGNGVVVYRVPKDKMEAYHDEDSVSYGFGERIREFEGDTYLAVHDTENDEILYVPDCYGVITGLELTEEGLAVRYIASDSAEDGSIGDMSAENASEGRDLAAIDSGAYSEVCLPVFFGAGQIEGTIDLYPYGRNRKAVLPGQDGLYAGENVFPRAVWAEHFWRKEDNPYEGSYELTFERAGPIYDLGLKSGGLFADYRLTLRKRENVISTQIILNAPVGLEQAHWCIDLSGDGFPCLVLCTEIVDGTYDHLRHTNLIWNAKEALFEEKPLPGLESQKFYPDDPDWSRLSDVCVGGVLLRNYYVPRRMTVDETAKYFIDAYVTPDPENCPSGSWFSLCTRYDSLEEGPLDTTVPQVACPAYEFDYGDSRRQLFVDGEAEWGVTEDYLVFDYFDWYYDEADDGERIYTHAWHIGRYAVNRYTKEIVPWRIYREDESAAEDVTIWEVNEAYLAIIDHEFRMKESYDE